MSFRNLLNEKIVLFDGAMGTMIQQSGLPTDILPEILNITHPDGITDIHRAFVKAGAHVITTNSFQAIPEKLKGQYSIKEVVSAAVKNAKASGAAIVALDVGTLGRLMEPMGDLGFDEAVEIYREIAVSGKNAGADLIIIETMSDLYETKAAVIAAKENTDLPVIATLSFDAAGHTFTGCDAVTAAFALSGLGVDALGANCSVGPDDLLPVAQSLIKYSRVPVIIQANAGLPVTENGKTAYKVDPAGFAKTEAKMAMMGARLLGGCCGTTPEFIAELKKEIENISPITPATDIPPAVTSGSKTVFWSDKTVVGSRINPSEMSGEIRAKDMDSIADEALSQVDDGCDIIAVNAAIPDIDEAETLKEIVLAVQELVRAPLMIKSENPAAVEAAARVYNGKPLLCVSGTNWREILPVAKKYGALVGCDPKLREAVCEAAGKLNIPASEVVAVI